MTNQNDIPLSDWGPYSRNYAGASWIIGGPDQAMLEVIPVIARERGGAIVPDVNVESGYHHWDAEPRLESFSYRYEIAFKDHEYADVVFRRMADDGESGVGVEITFVNNAPSPRTYVCVLFCFLRRNPYCRLELETQPASTRWLPAEDYAALDVRTVEDEPDYEGPGTGGSEADRPARETKGGRPVELAMGRDGLRRGVVEVPTFVGGLGLGNAELPPWQRSTTGSNGRFLMQPGTEITLRASQPVAEYSQVFVRYTIAGIERLDVEVAAGGTIASVSLTPATGVNARVLAGADAVSARSVGASGQTGGGGGVEAGWKTPDAPASSEARLVGVDLGRTVTSAEVRVRVVDLQVSGSLDTSAFALDGLLLTHGQDAESAAAAFSVDTEVNTFDCKRLSGEGGVVLRPKARPEVEVTLQSHDERALPPAPFDDAGLTHVYHDELGGNPVVRKLSNDSLTNWKQANCVIHGPGAGHFAGYTIGPVVCDSGRSRTARATIVGRRLAAGDARVGRLSARHGGRYPSAGSGEDSDWLDSPYRFSQERLRAQLITNLVYPVRIGREHCRTYTPGKRWGSLFTWDSGMHGIGLAQYAPDLATAIIRQFLMGEHAEPDVVAHGSPQPIHLYLAHEVVLRTGQLEILDELYRPLARYFRFFAGLSRNSWFRSGSSGILGPRFDGYSAAGIDDYPPQHHLRQRGELDSYAPVITTAHAIRTAKLMAMFASLTGHENDVDEYLAAARLFSQALQRYSWDDTGGYFSFTEMTTDRKLFFDDAGRVNYNMGLDGTSPLFAGICSDPQVDRIVGNLFSLDHMWTPFGITTVDKSAPYWRPDGYWVGKVWMPHQWLLFKGLLDSGREEEAESLVSTALSTWATATDQTYNCYELFDGGTGMGQGCHQFAGLSAPVASFYASWCRVGSVTVGFDALVLGRVYNREARTLRFELVRPIANNTTHVLAVMPSAGRYRVSVAGVVRTMHTDSGRLWVRVEEGGDRTPVEITRSD